MSIIKLSRNIGGKRQQKAQVGNVDYPCQYVYSV